MNTHSIQTNTHLKTKSKSQTSTHTNLEPKTPKPQEIDYSRVGDWSIKSLKATTSSPSKQSPVMFSRITCFPVIYFARSAVSSGRRSRFTLFPSPRVFLLSSLLVQFFGGADLGILIFWVFDLAFIWGWWSILGRIRRDW